MYRPEDMPLPAGYDQEDLPEWAAAARTAPDEETLRQHKAHYCGMVKLIDDGVGRILDALERQGILDDTILVFTSDHGEYMGEHGLMGKNQLYETAHRVPMLIRWPEKIAAGTRIDRIASTVDFQPTLLGLMDVSPSGREQGRDASPLLRGEEIEGSDQAFIHHSSHERAGIFTPDFELACVKDGDPVLFDRKNDPDQLHNLFRDPQYRDVVAELTQRVLAHHAGLDSPARAWLEEMG